MGGDVLGGAARPPDALPPGAQPSDALWPPVARQTPSPPPVISEDITGDDEIRVMADQWVLCFSDPIRGWIEGRLQHSPSSRWTSLHDMDNNILAGDYLAADVQIEVGMRFILVDFDVHVLSVLQEVHREEIEMIDLTTTHEAMREAPAAIAQVPHLPSDRGDRATQPPDRRAPGPCTRGAVARVGGRFWALAGADEDDADGDGDDPDASPPTPTPSDLVCEFFHAGYDEDEVASTVDRVLPVEDPARVRLPAGEKKEMVRRVVHRRTAATAVRPWKGPLPKVIFRATALIRSWSLLTPMKAREHLVTGSTRWEMVARDIFNRFGWRSCNRIGN
ncbi:hypothetical protein VPH35_123578 [Triticum aestivum]